MKFVHITSDEVKKALLGGNRISIQTHTYNEVRYAVDNPSDVDEHFKYDSDCEKMFFGYINNGKKNKYVFLIMQTTYSSDTEKCLDGLINIISNLSDDIKAKNLRINTLEIELDEQSDLSEIDDFNDSLDKGDDNGKLVPPISSQVKLPSQKSYITVNNFDMFT